MDNVFALLLLGITYTAVLSGLTYVRREGFSIRFIIESLLLTAIICIIVYLTKALFHPALFVILLYLVTMRVRLLVDWANNMARQEDFSGAEKIYALAYRMFPDSVNKLITEVNQGVCWLQQGKMDEAIALFKNILSNEYNLGARYKAAAHYNLAMAYRRNGNELLAIIELNHVLAVLPESDYARRADAELKKFECLENEVETDKP